EKIVTLKRDHDLEQITIAGYSDKAYSPESKGKLSDADSDLASDRISSVKSAIGDLEGVAIDVESYNLAESPNALEKLFKTDDFKLKDKSANAQETPRNLKLIKDVGGPQSALVVFKVRSLNKKLNDSSYSE